MTDEQIDAMLNELDDCARDYDAAEYGLPMHRNISLLDMRDVVRKYVATLAPTGDERAATVKDSLTAQFYVIVDDCGVPQQVLGVGRGVEAELVCRGWDEQRAPAYRPHRVVPCVPTAEQSSDVGAERAGRDREVRIVEAVTGFAMASAFYRNGVTMDQWNAFRAEERDRWNDRAANLRSALHDTPEASRGE